MLKWLTPSGTIPNLCADMAEQPHIIIAGATGSGKSVLLHSLIYTLLYQSPATVNLVMIDPKRVELHKYRKLPHVLAYASEPPDIAKTIRECVQIMERRFKRMRRKNQIKTDEPHIYIIVDEFADLMTTQKLQVLPLFCRLAQLGRAAGIHLIIATQRPTRDIINGQIKVNIDCRVALRCPTRQDSRNIINEPGAETLPRYGFGYYLTPETMRPVLVEIPFIDTDRTENIIKWWTDRQKCVTRKKKEC